MKRTLFSLLILSFVVCNHSPIDEDILSQRGDFACQELALLQDYAFTESENIKLGRSGNLILGIDSEEEYESRILLSFEFPDTTYQGLDAIKLILYRNNNLNFDTLKFSLHLLEYDFTEEATNWSYRDEGMPWFTPGGDYDEDSIRYGVATDDSLVIYFNYIELNQIQSAHGLIIIPRSSGFVGFSSKEGGSAPKFQVVKNGVTTTFSLNADCHIITGPEPYPTEDWVGSGFAYRNFVKFRIDSLLVAKKAIYGEFTFRTLGHFGMQDSIEIGIKELSQKFDGFDTPTRPLIALKKFALGDTIFSIDIVKYIQRIIDYPDSNFGFSIYISPENYAISRIEIVPNSYHLKVGYIMPPEGR